MTVSFLWLFLTVSWVGLQCVIAVFPDHTQILFMSFNSFTFIAFWCHVTVSVLCLFLMMPWVGLQCVIGAFPGHTHLLFICLCHGKILQMSRDM